MDWILSTLKVILVLAPCVSHAEYSFSLSAPGELDFVDPAPSIAVQPPDTVVAEQVFTWSLLAEDQGTGVLRAHFFSVTPDSVTTFLDSLVLDRGEHQLEQVLPTGEYAIRTILFDPFGNSGHTVSEWVHSVESTSVADLVGLPARFELFPAFPNPFNPATTIQFALPNEDRVRIGIYTIRGQLVEERDLGLLPPGMHSWVLDGAGYSSGLYFVRVAGRDEQQTGKVVLLK